MPGASLLPTAAAGALLLFGGARGDRSDMDQKEFIAVATRHFERLDSRSVRANDKEAAATSGNASASVGVSSAARQPETCVPWHVFARYNLCIGGDGLLQLAGGPTATPNDPPAQLGDTFTRRGHAANMGSSFPFTALLQQLFQRGGENSSAGSLSIPGSWHWWSCNHHGMHECGLMSCCCDRGREWSKSSRECELTREALRPGPKKECEGCQESLEFFNAFVTSDKGAKYRFKPKAACLAVAESSEVCVPWAMMCDYVFEYDPNDEEKEWDESRKEFEKWIKIDHQHQFPTTCP